MEIFVDFGLFELVAALGLSALACRVYTHAALRNVVLILSIAAPIGVIFLASTEGVRWMGAICLATTLLNLGVVLGAIQQGEIPRLRFPRTPPAPPRVPQRATTVFPPEEPPTARLRQ
jgi:hypothetical protein